MGYGRVLRQDGEGEIDELTQPVRGSSSCADDGVLIRTMRTSNIEADFGKGITIHSSVDAELIAEYRPALVDGVDE